jgi:predicted nucleotidyltransferase
MKKIYPTSEWVDPRIEIRPRSMAGRGMFACSPIGQGERVMVWGGHVFAAADVEAGRAAPGSTVYIGEETFLGSPPEAYNRERDDRGDFINHSCDPNVWMQDENTLVARREIAAGEELTLDYALFEGDENNVKPWICRCGSVLCRHRITGKDWRLAELQRHYQGNFSPFINERIRRQKVIVGSPDPLAAVVQRLATASSVAAVALVGSRASGIAEPGSDIDLFVYTDGDVGELRLRIADEFADPVAWRSIRDGAFGDGDVWRLTDNGEWLDLMYWSTAWGEAQLSRMFVDHTAAMGYSTAFWRSIRDACPLYERDTWHAGLQLQARQAYPEELRRNIIKLNRPYLRDHPFSYRHQAAKAVERHDVISVNHRVGAWLASYFDILFALNRVLHPGEKRLLEFVARECQVVPDGVAMSVQRLIGLSEQAASPLLDTLDKLTEDLEALLRREHLLAG